MVALKALFVFHFIVHGFFQFLMLQSVVTKGVAQKAVIGNDRHKMVGQDI